MKKPKEGKKVETELEKAYKEAYGTTEPNSEDREEKHWLIDSAFKIFESFKEKSTGKGDSQ